MYVPRKYDVPIVNSRLHASIPEFESLWRYGHPTEDSLSLIYAGEPYTRARRSENGKWHLKQFPLELQIPEGEECSQRGLTPEQLCRLNDYEHHRLKLLGYHIITFARIPSNYKRNIFTIAPWIDGMVDPSLTKYKTLVEPLEKQYYREWSEEIQNGISIRPFYAVDLEQVATLPELDFYFLYDTDPAVGGNADDCLLLG